MIRGARGEAADTQGAEPILLTHGGSLTLGKERAAWRIFRLWLGSVIPISLRSCSSITFLPYTTNKNKEPGFRGHTHKGTASTKYPVSSTPFGWEVNCSHTVRKRVQALLFETITILN